MGGDVILTPNSVSKVLAPLAALLITAAAVVVIPRVLDSSGAVVAPPAASGAQTGSQDGGVSGSTAGGGDRVEAAAEEDSADVGAQVDVGAADVARIGLEVPEPATGPSTAGLVRLSEQGMEATADLQAILSGSLPEPAGPGADRAPEAEPDLPAFDAATAPEASVYLAGPIEWEPGNPIEVGLRIGGSDVAAVEAVVAYDPNQVEFAGVDDPADQTQVLINDRGPSLVVAAHACSSVTCDPTIGGPTPVNELRLRFVPLDDAPGHTINVGSVRLVRTDGSVVDADVAPIVIGDGQAAGVPSGARWQLADAGAGNAATPSLDALDHTADGRLDGADVSEAVIAWHETRALGDPCGLAARPWLSGHDVSGDGCVDVVDLHLLLASDALAAAPANPAVAVAVPQGSGSPALGMAGSPFAAGLAALAAAVDFDPYSWPARVGTPTFVVDSTGDELDASLSDNVCATATGTCTLRAAIQQANATTGENRIEFAIPGAGPHTIKLTTSRLPVISDMTGGVTIDGYSQPGSVANSHPERFDATLQIQIEGSGVGLEAVTAFTVTSPDNVIRGLSIYNATYGVYLEEDFAQRNHIVGNIIGTNIAATWDLSVLWGSNGSGIFLNAGPKFNIIGTPDPADRNVLSGNASWGVRMDQGGTDGNVMWNNIVGLSPDGTRALPNNGGVDVQWRAQFNVIGGLNVGERNVFSGSDYTGVDFSHEATDNYVLGNLMGTTLDGTAAPAHTRNTFSVILKDDARANYIIGNVLSNNRAVSSSLTNGRGHAIWNKHDYTGRNTILDNYIGITIDGQPAGSERFGIMVNGHDDIIENNVIAYNQMGGVYVVEYNGSGANGNEATRFNRLSRNTFYGNSGLGIDIDPVGQSSNDPGDGDSGPNDRLNFPTFTSVSAGQITGTACAGCEVEVYLADETAADPQGQQYLGSVVAAANGTFTLADGAIAPGRQVTALAIDTLANTSEFTPTQPVPGNGGGGLPTSDGPPDPGVVPTPDDIPASAGGRLETVSTTVGSGWAAVGFAGSFTNPIATCSVRYAANTAPVVVRMRNVGTTGMELRLQNPGDGTAPVADTVDCLVAEAGAWVLPDGTPMEAFAVDVAAPDHAGNWTATPVTLSNTFSSPLVVLGQVMTENDSRWSTFWSRGNSQWNPPTPTSLNVGYHVGEDPDTARAGERVGVIVFDEAHGTLGGVEFETGRTPDIVTGPSGAAHTFASAFAAPPTVGVVTQMAMDGGHGSWVYAEGPLTANAIGLRADEDQVADTERTHPDEMAAYAVFSGPLNLAWGASPGFQPGLVAFDDFERTYDEFWGVATFGGAWHPSFGEEAREQFSIAGGRGLVATTPGKGYEALLQAVHQEDIDTTLVATLDSFPDANYDVNVHHRWIDSKTFYRGRLRLQSDGSVRVQVVRADNGVFSSLAAVNAPGLSFTPGSDLAVRVETFGTAPTTIRIKVWDAAEPEPFGWTLSVDDATPSLQQPGAVALRFQAQSSSNLSAVWSVDDIIVTDSANG